jgi:dihydroorotate dehydrogenase (NAD+) catalytic subunit
MIKPDLRVNLGGLLLATPILAASGPLGNSHEYRERFSITDFGAIITKGVSLEPWAGNRPPRLAESASGVLNAIGLQNPGLKQFLERDLPQLKNAGPQIIVNIVGRTVEEYARIAAALNIADGVSGIEVNISCPNIKAGGLAFGTDPGLTYSVVSAVRRQTTLPLLVKLSPNVTDITVIARAAEEAGADSLSLINTLSGMLIDIETRQPVLGNIFGGLSGQAILPVALKMVWQVAEAVKIPLLGMGGISSLDDVLQFIMAGARAVAVGTALFYSPELPAAIHEGLSDYMIAHGITNLKSLEGIAHKGVGSF